MMRGEGVELHGRRGRCVQMLRVLHAGTVMVEISGVIGGQMAVTRTVGPDSRRISVLAADRVVTARKRGMRQATVQHFELPDTPLALPDGSEDAASAGDAASDVVAEALQAQFLTAWQDSWASRCQELRARALPLPDTGDQWVLLVLRDYAAVAGSAPWGAALTEVLAQAQAATDPAADVALLRVRPYGASWLRAYYGGALSSAPAELPAHADDTSETYQMALGLWQPELGGPLATLSAALTTARSMF